MKRANCNFFPVFLAIALVLCVRTESQTSSDQQQDLMHSDQTLRTNTRLVVVDVVATDSKGQPVPDLKAADFTVLEDGKPQKISGFNFEHSGGAPAQVVQINLPPSVVTNAPKFQSNSLNVILFDTVNGDFAEHAYARDQLLKFLNSAELGRPVAIFALQTQLKLLHDFTTDNKALSAAVAKYRPPTTTINSESIESRASAFSTRGDYHTSERGIETTLNQLNVLAKVLAGYPGRKNLIWLSESFPLVLFPETTNQLNMDGQSLRSAEVSVGQSVNQNLQIGRPFQGLRRAGEESFRLTDGGAGSRVSSGCWGRGQRRPFGFPAHYGQHGREHRRQIVQEQQ